MKCSNKTLCSISTFLMILAGYTSPAFATSTQSTEKAITVEQTTPSYNNINISEQDKDIARQAAKIQNNPHMIVDKDLAEIFKKNRDTAQALEFYQKLEKENPVHRKMAEQRTEQERNQILNGEYHTLIFISYSLERQAIKEILSHAAKDSKALVVMRGIPDGTNITQGLALISELAGQFDPPPNVVLQPLLFSRFNVNAVPTIIKLDPSSVNEFTVDAETLKEVARVQGMSDSLWLEQQLQAGITGDLGIRGPITGIAEKDFIELMKERAAGIDWEAKKKAALARVWKNQQFYPLPKATRHRVRLIDPTVVVSEDILDADGKVIIKKGHSINPLDVHSFEIGLVIFDPLDQKQIEVAKKEAQRLLTDKSILQVHFIATQMDREKGWDFYNKTSADFGAHIFLLNSDVVNRFNLQAVPSIVQAKDGKFMVTEVDVKDQETATVPLEQTQEIPKETGASNDN